MLVGIVENVAAKVETDKEGRTGVKLQVNIPNNILINQVMHLNVISMKFPFPLNFSSLIDQFFGGTFDIEMKCTESEDEQPTFTQDNFLQLSCFISQEVKYMLSGIKSVSPSI